MKSGVKNHMAIDHYGETYHNLGPHPRKELMRRLNRQHASKMYTEFEQDENYHTGYVIAKLWFNVYEVIPWRRPA